MGTEVTRPPKPSDTFPVGHTGVFGAPGSGGSMGYADPQVGIGYGYVTNRMGTDLHGDPRDVALRDCDPDDRVPAGRLGPTRVADEREQEQ
jgi:CubicO group peptidase (beta-lactamase class C family)